jgi:hypothetical protein
MVVLCFVQVTGEDEEDYEAQGSTASADSLLNAQDQKTVVDILARYVGSILCRTWLELR